MGKRTAHLTFLFAIHYLQLFVLLKGLGVLLEKKSGHYIGRCKINGHLRKNVTMRNFVIVCDFGNCFQLLFFNYLSLSSVKSSFHFML